MASQDYLNEINRTNQEINNLVNSQGAARTQNLQGLKDKFKYQDRVNTIDSLKKNASETDRLLSDLPTNLKRRTAGRLMTSGQRDRIQAAEAAPIAKQYADISRGIGVEQQGLDLLDRMIGQEQGQFDQGYRDKLAALESQRATAGQLYGTAAQNEIARSQLALQQSIAAAERRAQERAQQRADAQWELEKKRIYGDGSNFTIEIPDMPNIKGASSTPTMFAGTKPLNY